jgi:hypothetical protein
MDRCRRLLHEFREKPLAVGRRRGAREAGPQAARCIGSQRELRHGEQLAADVLERQVHLALRVGKDAVGQHALGKALRFRLAVAALDADEGEDAAANGGDVGAVDRDPGV